MKQALIIFIFFLLTVLSTQISGNKGQTKLTGDFDARFQQVVDIPGRQDPADLEDEDDIDDAFIEANIGDLNNDGDFDDDDVALRIAPQGAVERHPEEPGHDEY